MKLSVKQHITRNLLNIPGWQSNQKFVVIESDDWGTIRMESKTALSRLKEKGYPVDICPYGRNDALESNEDLYQLFDLLTSIRGEDGKPVKLTVNNIVANPDFESIEKSGFQNYYWEPFTTTLKRYPQHEQVFSIYKQGIAQGLIQPQFHGREHLNVGRWMKALQLNDKDVREGFKLSVFSFRTKDCPVYTNEYMDAFDIDSIEQLKFHEQSICEGLNLFEQIWGFRSKSFIAPCYIWSKELEPLLYDGGIEYIQGMVNQFVPQKKSGTFYHLKYHYQGQQNEIGQRYLIRNAFFEPAINPSFPWEQDCLDRVETAFRWNKPAIICSHRINYMGYLNPDNRKENLIRLENLLRNIIKRWPDVRFISTDELGKLISEGK